MANQPKQPNEQMNNTNARPGVEQGRDNREPAKEEGRSLDRESTDDTSESDMIEE